MNTTTWTEAKIQRLINDEVEESLFLDYKAADALGKNNDKKKEITKDVSAMANSAGGTIIYGIKEYQQKGKTHLPEKTDPINRQDFSKEWLEQVISNIRPRIGNVLIHSVSIGEDSNNVIYIVEVPQSFTPHQASDLKYYKRFNFESTAMYDYEINDIRNRRSVIEKLLNFEIVIKDYSIVLFSVENIGDRTAFDVKFNFSPELIWAQGNCPPLFKRGVNAFHPNQKYVFFYQSFVDIMNDSNIPKIFELEITYTHPQIEKQISDSFFIDFSDYMLSTRIKSDIEEQTDSLQKAIKELKGELNNLNKKFQHFPMMTKPTGFNLSFTALNNLRHLIQNDELEKFDPTQCDMGVFREVLGVDLNLAYKIERFFRSPNTDSQLENIEGISDDIIAKIAQHFLI